LQLVLMGALTSCFAGERGGRPRDGTELAPGEVARVGEQRIATVSVANVVAARGGTARDALDALIEDALLAEAARARRVDGIASNAATLKATRARATVRQLWGGAQGPPSDTEIAELRRERWKEFDRPESVRAVHVLVVRPKDSPKMSDAARALARRLFDELRATTSPEQFLETGGRDKRRDGFDIVAQPLPAFALDGRILEADGTMDTVFAAGTFALKNVGDTSAPVETPFGLHVIRLTHRFPAYHATRDELLEKAAHDILRKRGRGQYEALLGRLRGGKSVVVEPVADDLMGSAVRSFEGGD
jgi:hypothetical protein